MHMPTSTSGMPTSPDAQSRLPPIDIAAKFGEQPDVDEVDAHVRSVMQSAPTRLAHRRRFPVLG